MDRCVGVRERGTVRGGVISRRLEEAKDEMMIMESEESGGELDVC